MKPEELYLDYFNNFLTIKGFADYYNMTESAAQKTIDAGRAIHELQFSKIMPKNYFYYANNHFTGIQPMGYEPHNDGRGIALDVLNWTDSGHFIRYARKKYDASNIMDFLRLFPNWS